MSIFVSKNGDGNLVFSLETGRSLYQMATSRFGHLLHAHYGEKAAGQDFSYLFHKQEFGFCPCPWDAGDDRTYSLDSQPQEYPTGGAGDFRASALDVLDEKGAGALDLRYESHAVYDGKYTLPGLPAFYEERPGEGEAQTLSVVLSDARSGLRAELLYGVFFESDVICRAAIITNAEAIGSGDARVVRAQSANIDFQYDEFELIHFHGRHAMEREPERVPVVNGIVAIRSGRGHSGHQHNPGFVLCERGAGEDHGRCYGFNLVYSGGFLAQIERDQTGGVRVNLGVGYDGFCIKLARGESFATPEAVMSFSADGLSGLSHNFHRAVRRNLCGRRHMPSPRPVVLNNWEATYFDFTGDKLLEIAAAAPAIGADTFVMDDGWFGARDSDRRGLGDWRPNEKKLGRSLGSLAKEVKALGLRFGIWVEPEMVNEDSDLYRARPDWVLAVPGRKPAKSRGQLALDMSRRDVRDYLYDAMRRILDSADIDYVKWDMNRSLCDWHAGAEPPDRQGEVPHRFILGLYDLMEKLTSEYPRVLFEGCAGGGGRFDLGMLAYFPQIWTSDNTDPVARLKIQYGTSFFYPASSIAAHISASPNHQTGRESSIEVRAAAALYGAFGFELDATAMSDGERAGARAAADLYRRFEVLISEGLYYRLTDPYDSRLGVCAWQYVKEDCSLLVAVVTEPMANAPLFRLRLKGLRPTARYRVRFESSYENAVSVGGAPKENPDDGSVYTGAALMCAGLPFARPFANSAAIVVSLKMYSCQ